MGHAVERLAEFSAAARPGRGGSTGFTFGNNSMRSSHFNLLSWLVGYSGWSFYCALVSLFGLTGYYADLLRPHVPDWLGVGLLIAPMVIILFIQWGEAPDRIVVIAHTFAASWFMALALGMEVGILLGHEPRGSGFYRLLAHLGWACAWAGIYRRARARAQEAEQIALPNGGPVTRFGNSSAIGGPPSVS
jgi:hypothetical protein